MNNIKKKLLSAGLAATMVVVPVLGGIMAASCKNSTSSEEETANEEETAEDVTIATYNGKTVVVKGLRPIADAAIIAKIKGEVEHFLGLTPTPGTPVDDFQKYITSQGLMIVVEDVSAYASGKDFRIISVNEFAMRYVYVDSELGANVGAQIVEAIGDMNGTYGIVLLDKQFNNAKETIRLSLGRFQRSQIQA
jgi:hypothetical protein